MDDLTVMYITSNLMPDRWVEFQIDHLLRSAGDSPIISVSRKPMNLGINILQTEPRSYWNIYMMMLEASLIATTPFVAMAEDDVLYTKEHFTQFRPPMNKVAYDFSRWCLFTWDNMYCMRQRPNNSTLIAPRELLIEALTERKNKWPNGHCDDSLVGEVGRPDVERNLRVSHRETVEWYSTNPIIQLTHFRSTHGDFSKKVNGRHMVKKHGQIKAYDIPYWGKAEDVLKFYDN